MPLAADLVALLDANSTKITAGTSLFQNALPETTGRCVAVFETPGLPAVEKFATDLPAIERPRCQIMARSTASVGGSGIAGSTGTRVLIGDMWEIVQTVQNENVNSNYYERLMPLQSPFFLRHDEKGRAVFMFNVQVMKAPTTNA